MRCDSAYYNHDVVAAARRGGAHFSVTASADPAVRKAIASIGEDAWVAINYPEAIWDEDEGRWISDAEVAEVRFTAFTSRRKAEHVTARLIVRRVRRLNPASVPAGQSFHCLDSSQAVRDVVAKYDVRHVIIGTGFIIPSMKRAPGLTALSQSRFLRLLYDRGDVQIYEIYEIDLQPRVAAGEDRACRGSNSDAEGDGAQ
ncbi:MAG TPA: hypothetical protein VIG96_00930 [Blastococcus sp.]